MIGQEAETGCFSQVIKEEIITTIHDSKQLGNADIWQHILYPHPHHSGVSEDEI